MSEKHSLHIPFDESQATLGNPKTNRKRMIIGSLIGGGIFLGAVIAICVLVYTGPKAQESSCLDTNSDPVLPHYNPYFVDKVIIESKQITTVNLINKRRELEGNSYPCPHKTVPIVKNTTDNYEPDKLVFHVITHDEQTTRFLLIDPEFRRWSVPHFGGHSDPDMKTTQNEGTYSGFELIKDANNSFQWQFVNGFVPIIHTKKCRLQYFDKYIEFEGILQQSTVYGMGERIESFQLKETNYSLWNRYYPYPAGGDSENGMYGSHPFILTHPNGQNEEFTGLFIRNSNAMLFSTWSTLQDGTFINFKMIGGILDMYLFHSADPQCIIRKYHSIIGKPYLPPMWAMGLQQARAGYTVNDFKEIINKHDDYRIPIDALWADTEMNDGYKTFTVNSNSFAGIKDLVSKMHNPSYGINMHFVAIANPNLKADTKYPYYKEALEQDCLIKSAVNLGKPFEGRTMAGTSSWLDFFSHKAVLIWAGGLHSLYEHTLFDGIWISENEIDQFCSGECARPDSDADLKITIPDPFHNASEFENLQYIPTLDPLNTNTLHMAAYQDGDHLFHKQYFTHNLFGIQIAQATFDSLLGIFEDNKYFIASRSTWAGSGQFTSHWLDGNYGTWDSMVASISGMLDFNLFGIPHVGAPIGGFFGNCEGELLTRWFQLGAYSPLMLSYSNAGTNRKEAYADPKYIAPIRNAIMERYALIKFMYTKMFEAHTLGGVVIHPLFFDFMNDATTYNRDIVDRTFMWAHTLYVIPPLISHIEATSVYLPNWRWFDLRTKALVMEYNPHIQHGSYMTFMQELGYTPVLIKGGSIIPHQNSTNAIKVMSVNALRRIPTEIIVAPDHNWSAHGNVYYDIEHVRNAYKNIEMSLDENQITFNMLAVPCDIAYTMPDRFISNITILNGARYMNATISKYETKSHQIIDMKPVVFDPRKQILIIEPVNYESMDIMDLIRVYWS